MSEKVSFNKPIERVQNESLADYMARLYAATLGISDSILEALQRDPINFARLLNHLPQLIQDSQKQNTQDTKGK